MRRKMMVVGLVGIMLFTSACGTSQPTVNTQQSEVQTESTETEVSSQVSTGADTAQENDISELDALGSVEVEEELFDVTLTIPADYAEGVTQESLNESVKEKGWKSATLNDDGSITYVMTKKQHKEMMNEFAQSINESLQELCNSEDYPNFVSVTAEDEFTKFTIVTKSEELDLNESFSVMMFYMYGGMYHIFNGTSPVDNIHVDFVNETSGEIISSADSKDMANTETQTE